jgi:hypothetical protein
METLEGVWLYEISELAGMRFTDVNKIKSFASRTVDRARPAYARFSESRPRRGILVGTTNDDQYLKDETGNRRFWPIRTGAIDLESLADARDQLWAEAAHREARGESIILPRKLWQFAAAEQQKRLESDGWEIALEAVRGNSVHGREVITSGELMHGFLAMRPSHVQSFHYRRLARAMRALGWQGPVAITMPNGKKAKGYWRLIDDTDDLFAQNSE